MPKAMLESTSGQWVAFADLQHANDDAEDEDSDVDDSPGLPDGDDDDLSTMSVESTPAEEDDVPDQEDDATAGAASAEQQTAAAAAGHEPSPLLPAAGEDSNSDEEIPPLPTAAEEPPLPAAEDEPSLPVPKGRNPHCHHLLGRGKCVFLSLDVETGGEYCGILQLSAEICHLTIQTSGRSSSKDTAAAIQRDANTFNAYVRPADGAIYSEACTNIHGLTADSPCIQQASDIDVVWSQFVNWINTSTARDEQIVIVAYNGEKCDMKWLWKLTQAPFTHLSLPTRIKYFMDPYKVMDHYKTCRLNKRFTKLDSYELGVMWRYIQLPEIKNLNGAHNSLVDAKAQTDLFTHPEFVPFINRAASIQPVDKIFSSTSCYFCKNGHTTGIAHKRRKETTVYKCGTRVTNDECSVKRVGLGKGSNYCRMCYRKQDASWSFEQKKEKCRNSTMGCKICQEPICKHCWEEGYDKHA